jgi:hypothetical protein
MKNSKALEDTDIESAFKQQQKPAYFPSSNIVF